MNFLRYFLMDFTRNSTAEAHSHLVGNLMRAMTQRSSGGRVSSIFVWYHYITRCVLLVKPLLIPSQEVFGVIAIQNGLECRVASKVYRYFFQLKREMGYFVYSYSGIRSIEHQLNVLRNQFMVQQIDS